MICFFLSSCAQNKRPQPKVENGVLNLTAYDMAALGPVALDGQWEFYFGQFLPPQAFRETAKMASGRMLMPVPDSWNHHSFGGMRLPADSSATYRLRIRLGPKDAAEKFLSLRLDTVGTAYTLFVNGVQTVSVGRPNSLQIESSGSYKVLTLPVQPQKGEIELVFHVSNYLHRSGGLWFSHHLGTVEQINRMREKGLFIDFILLGALFIIGFYHVSLFLNRRRELPVLHFGLFCLMVAFRVPFTGEFFLTQLFPDFPLSLQLRLEYATVYITPIFIISFIAHSYAEKTRKFILYYSRIISLLFFATVLFLPPFTFTGFIGFYDIFLLSIVIWGFSVMFVAVRRKETNALISLLLMLLLAVTLANDLLFSLEYIYTTSMLPFGLISFVFVQAVLLSRKFYHAFELSEKLSTTLTVTNRDLTQLKDSLEQKVQERTEVLQEKNHELAVAINTREKFLSIIAHDLRSPLIGMARVFEAANAGSIRFERKMIPALAKTVRECVNLLENMLNWALSQKNQLKVFADNLQLKPLSEKITTLFEHIAHEKRITLQSRVAANLWLHADRAMLETVLRNLLGNAVKFTPENGAISIEALKKSRFVRIEIHDSGPGIAAENLAALFEGAHMTERRTAPLANEGTGLGLIICKEFVEANGGTIGALSAVGQGSTFWFEIPAGIASEVEFSVAPGTGKISEVNFRHLRALIVEDNAIHMQLAEAVLAELGISAEMATDGMSAWNLLQSETFDFVLLDGKIPGIDGFTLAAKLAGLSARPRIIFHSSLSEEEIRNRVAQNAFDAILPKPLDKDALVKILIGSPRP